MNYLEDNFTLIRNLFESELLSGSVLRAYRICAAQKMKNCDVYLKDHISQHQHVRKQDYKFAMLVRLINEELERKSVSNNLSFGSDENYLEYPEFDFDYIKSVVNNQSIGFLSRILAYSLYMTIFFSGLQVYQKSDKIESTFASTKPYIIKPLKDARVDLVADNLIDGDPSEDLKEIPVSVFRSVLPYDGHVPDYAIKSVVFFGDKCYSSEEIRRYLEHNTA